MADWSFGALNGCTLVSIFGSLSLALQIVCSGFAIIRGWWFGWKRNFQHRDTEARRKPENIHHIKDAKAW
jgi:hypothetical protein